MNFSFNFKLFCMVAVSLGVVFLICINAIFRSVNVESKNSTVVLLHIMFRHGDRTTIRDVQYASDPYINETYYPYGIGELTNDGKRKMYSVGKQLRKSYNTFLGENFHPDLLDARTSVKNRCVTSMQLVLAGLFPPKGNLRWFPGLNWQPIPFAHSDPADKLLTNPLTYCKSKWDFYFKELMSKEEIKNITKQNQGFYNYIQEHTGWALGPVVANFVFYNLQNIVEWGLELPEWAKKIYPEPVTSLNVQFWNFWTTTDNMIKISGGFLFKKIIDDTTRLIENNSKTKLHLYSGHDMNIVVILRLLGFRIKEHPPYGASLILEVHKIESSYYIQVVYQKRVGERSEILEIPLCGKLCRFETFVELKKKYLPTKDMC